MDSGVSAVVVVALLLGVALAAGVLLVMIGVGLYLMRRRPVVEPKVEPLQPQSWVADVPTEEPTGEHTLVVGGFGQHFDGDAEHTELISDEAIQALLHGDQR